MILGARVSLTAVLHTWGSALTHHPHVHIIVPGGGLSPDSGRWISCQPGFFLPVRVLSRLFRRLFLDGLAALHAAGRLAFLGDLAPLAEKCALDAALAPLRCSDWFVYAKRPFAGPQAVLAYLARYTHRVAISNSRLIRLADKGVTFKWIGRSAALVQSKSSQFLRASNVCRCCASMTKRTRERVLPAPPAGPPQDARSSMSGPCPARTSTTASGGGMNAYSDPEGVFFTRDRHEHAEPPREKRSKSYSSRRRTPASLHPRAGGFSGSTISEALCQELSRRALAANQAMSF